MAGHHLNSGRLVPDVFRESRAFRLNWQMLLGMTYGVLPPASVGGHYEKSGEACHCADDEINMRLFCVTQYLLCEDS